MWPAASPVSRYPRGQARPDMANRPDPQESTTTATSPARWLHILSWIGCVAIVGAAAWILRRYLSQIAWRDVTAAWSQLPDHRIAYSVAATTVSFAMLAMFDVLAAHTVVRDRVS